MQVALPIRWLITVFSAAATVVTNSTKTLSVTQNGEQPRLIGLSEARQPVPEEDPTLQFELNEEAIGLVLKSVSFYLERWPGGPDPSEQEGLIKLKSLFAAALLEYNFNRSGGELT